MSSILPNSAGWKWIGPKDDPQPGAVDLPADAGGDEQQQQAGDAEPVLVLGAATCRSRTNTSTSRKATRPTTSHMACLRARSSSMR